MDPPSHDTQLRQAAFSHVDRLAILRGGVLDSADLAGGFEFGGDRIPLINPQRGIFKPRQMEDLLSIKTVFPRRGLASGMTISAKLISRSRRVMMSSTMHSCAPTRILRITAGSRMRCRNRSRRSISSAQRPRRAIEVAFSTAAARARRGAGRRRFPDRSWRGG
jgi:hypothetical protein